MGCAVYVHEDAVEVTFTGGDVLMCLKSSLRLAMDDIVEARLVPQAEAKQNLRWRVGGGYFPGWFATGHYTVRDRPGARALWRVYRDPEVLEIVTRLERPCSVVLQHPDRARLAWLVNEKVAQRRDPR